MDPRSPKVVVIDAGHGGKNEGAIVHGRSERDIVLAISLRLQEMLEKRPAISPYLTRWNDDFVALSDRVLQAETVNGSAFVSLHVDNNRRRRGRGVMLYVYGKNRTIPEGPPREPGEQRLPPPPRSQIGKSRRLAAHMDRAFKRHGIRTTPDVDQGGFAVLKSARMPSVLVELGNLRDLEEAAWVSDPEFQERAAAALADGIENYLLDRFGVPGPRPSSR